MRAIDIDIDIDYRYKNHIDVWTGVFWFDDVFLRLRLHAPCRRLLSFQVLLGLRIWIEICWNLNIAYSVHSADTAWMQEINKCQSGPLDLVLTRPLPPVDR